MLVNDLLQDKRLVHGAVLRSVACLSRRPQVLLLCELDQDASIQPAEGLTHCYWPVVGCVCGVTLLENGGHQGGLLMRDLQLLLRTP